MPEEAQTKSSFGTVSVVGTCERKVESQSSVQWIRQPAEPVLGV